MTPSRRHDESEPPSDTSTADSDEIPAHLRGMGFGSGRHAPVFERAPARSAANAGSRRWTPAVATITDLANGNSSSRLSIGPSTTRARGRVRPLQIGDRSIRSSRASAPERPGPHGAGRRPSESFRQRNRRRNRPNHRARPQDDEDGVGADAVSTQPVEHGRGSPASPVSQGSDHVFNVTDQTPISTIVQYGSNESVGGNNIRMPNSPPETIRHRVVEFVNSQYVVGDEHASDVAQSMHRIGMLFPTRQGQH